MKHYKSVEFLSIFRIWSPPRKNAKPPIENFLATVLSLLLIHYFVHKKPNLTQIKEEFKYLRAQRHGQPKILEGSKCLILDDQQYFVWDTAS